MSASRSHADVFSGFPATDVAPWLAGRSLLVVSPHPDDESLGVGGLIASAASLGVTVTVVFVTSGEGSHRGSLTYPADALARLREDEARRAVNILAPGKNDVHFLGLPDSGLEAFPHERRVIEAIATHMTPDTVACVTAHTDPHADHRQSFAWVRAASKKTGAALWAYPVWTWLSDAPGDESLTGVRLDVSTHLATKRRAIAAHRSQQGLVIDDALEAFVLPQRMIDRLCQPYEALIRVHE